MKTQSFRNLQVWQRSMALARDIFRLTDAFPKSQLFGLTSQMQRCAVSVPSNIAEGHGRMTDKSFSLFLSQARGSLNELETQVELALRLQFAKPDESRLILQEITEVGKMLNALLTAVRQRERTPTASS
jgi:four helix bundle protein